MPFLREVTVFHPCMKTIPVFCFFIDKNKRLMRLQRPVGHIKKLLNRVTLN